MAATHPVVLDVAIVIVSYNVRELLRRCLSSVYASSDEVRFEVFVVDNQSRDGTVEMVGRCFPQARLIVSETNGGYARANNRALQAVLDGAVGDIPRYVLLLNPDTELEPRTLAQMIGFMDGHPEAGVAGPRLVRPNGSLDLACRRSFPTPSVAFCRMIGLSRLLPRSRRFGRYNLTYLDDRQVVEVDSVVGAFMMVRGGLLRRVGLLDEAFFMYGEDLDWAYRIKQLGWQVLYNGRVTVLHHKGASSKQRSWVVVEFYRAMLIFFRKHYAASTPWPIRQAVVAGIYAAAGLALLRNVLRDRRIAPERS